LEGRLKFALGITLPQHSKSPLAHEVTVGLLHASASVPPQQA
jgi:hypothetical protein